MNDGKLWFEGRFCGVHARGVEVKLTGAFHALVYEAIEQRAAVVTESGTGVGLDLECVSTLQVLEGKRNWGEESQTTEIVQYFVFSLNENNLSQSFTHTHTYIGCWADGVHRQANEVSL